MLSRKIFENLHAVMENLHAVIFRQSLFKSFDPNSVCFAKLYVMHFVRTFLIMRAGVRLIAIEKFEVMEKFCIHQKHF